MHTTKTKTPYKTAKTIKPYTCICKGWKITVPAGSTVSNQTACGNDDYYRFFFWQGWRKQIRDLTGFPNSMLAHDLEHYGLNIPAEYCESYSA